MVYNLPKKYTLSLLDVLDTFPQQTSKQERLGTWSVLIACRRCKLLIPVTTLSYHDNNSSETPQAITILSETEEIQEKTWALLFPSNNLTLVGPKNLKNEFRPRGRLSLLDLTMHINGKIQKMRLPAFKHLPWNLFEKKEFGKNSKN